MLCREKTDKRPSRRTWSERDTIATLLRQGVVIMCGCGCGRQIKELGTYQREHEIALGLAAPERRREFDIPANCSYWLKECSDRKTNGTKATTAGSDKHLIAKSRRLRNHKPKVPGRIRSRPFQQSPERIAKLARRDFVRNGGDL